MYPDDPMEKTLWFILFLFMLIEAIIVLLLVAPMPSNSVRGALLKAITGTWESQTAVRYVSYAAVIINALYLWRVSDALKVPLYAFGILEDPLISCELRASRFERERNAYITGFSLFLFLVLRRLVDIQAKLFESRADAKSASAVVPMGAPIAGARAPKSHFE
jgi:B-cell receptor-associated protein 31